MSEQHNGAKSARELSGTESQELVSFANSLQILYFAGIDDDVFSRSVADLISGYAKKHHLEEEKTAQTVFAIMRDLLVTPWFRVAINLPPNYTSGMICKEAVSSEENVVGYVRQGFRRLQAVNQEKAKGL
jgi:hypothetical protein